VWFVRTALCFLVAGITAGATLLAGRGLGAGSWLTRLLPLHAEFLLVGWMVQLVLGVAYWILPRSRSGAERGHPALAWAAYGALNAGVMLAALGGVLAAAAPVLAGRALEALAAGAFAVQAWPRIRRYRESA
jgi:heme/copper-type cytochrome/quinol oxidase subunit 1